MNKEFTLHIMKIVLTAPTTWSDKRTQETLKLLDDVLGTIENYIHSRIDEECLGIEVRVIGGSTK
jgi:hypothetical protein